MRSRFILVASVALLLLLLVSLIYIMNSGVSRPPPPPPPLGHLGGGVNFLEGYSYGTSETVLQHEMQVFKSGNVSMIFLGPTWPNIERYRGTFDDVYLDKVKHVVDVASAYGIQCILAIFTNTLQGSSTIPGWVSPQAYQTVITDSGFRSDWLSMLGHVASIFGNSVYAYVPLDEPQLSGDHISSSTAADCLSLWAAARLAIRQYSGKLFAVRFDSVYFNYFKNEPNFYTVNDFACINFYTDWTENHNPIRGNSASAFATQAAEVKANGKLLIVGGCGYASTDDAVQSQWLAHDLNIFVQNKVDFAMVWYWSSTSWLGSPGWNLCANSAGDPRPAFNILAGYN